MGKVKLKNIRVYAYHGCLKEETRIGSDYLVAVTISADLSKAALSDALVDTVDYVLIHQIVTEEMKIPSKLLEHVAQRIGQRIFSETSLVTKSKVTISKVNPPIGGDVERVSIKLAFNR